MKTLEQRYDGQNVLHSDKSPKDVLREGFKDTCTLMPNQTEVPRSLKPGQEYVKSYSIMDRDGCEKGCENYTGVTLVELP